MSKKRPQKKLADGREIPINWYFPDDLVSGYATNILVQAGPEEFYVSFFEAPPPVIMRPEDVEKINEVEAECIARIVINPRRMGDFIRVLQQQFEAFNARQGKPESAQEVK